jgi:hypothetical protein
MRTVEYSAAGCANFNAHVKAELDRWWTKRYLAHWIPRARLRALAGAAPVAHHKMRPPAGRHARRGIEMTPAETEHFAALRMHVAHLHAALKGAVTWLEGWAEVGSAREPYDQAVAALNESEASVAELLKEADRDNALVQARAERDAAIEATAAIGRRCTAIGSASRHLVAVYRQQDAGTDDWAGAMTAAVEELAQVLTA